MNHIASKKLIKHAKINLVLVIKNNIKSEIIVITKENIETPLIMFSVPDKKHQNKFP